MRFTLYYDGELPSSANAGRPEAKHAIREKLHPQILQLFRDHPALPKPERQDWAHWANWAWPHLIFKNASTLPDSIVQRAGDAWREEHTVIEVGNLHYLPLVRAQLELICDLDVLFLRPGTPGLIERGTRYDIDNRLLTLFDGLTVPIGDQKNYAIEHNKLDVNSPIFCLLGDDSRITAINVRTDSLLVPADGAKPNDVRLIIGVTVRTAHKIYANSGIAE